MADSGTRTAPRLTEQVAEEIRALLGRRRISGRELARRMGASHSWVNFRLTGSQSITLDDLERFASALDVSINDLLPSSVNAQPLVREPVSAGTGPHPNGRSLDLAVQTWLNGHPNRTPPSPATRRPARITQVNARPRDSRPMSRPAAGPAR